MELKPLPFRSSLDRYQHQAEALLAAHRGSEAHATRIIHKCHPRFLDAETPWLPKRMSEAEIRSAAFDLEDARLAIARWYDFADWPALEQYVHEVTREGSAVFVFESAVEAVVEGDSAALDAQLRSHPDLVRARSTRITHSDPPVHRATLLHYVAANGVEGHRQKTPANAVAVATALLEAGAVVDALADMYGSRYTTMCMLVSSCHPAKAGVQVALVDALVDFGAAVEPQDAGKWSAPLLTALAFGYMPAAAALVRRGARVDSLVAAAGLGRVSEAARMLPLADPLGRHRALALAAQHGHLEVVRLLLDAGEDPNRYNPDGNHSHSTPLHQAVLAGHQAVVRLLVERGARLDIEDKIYRGTPLGWARYGGQTRSRRTCSPAAPRKHGRKRPPVQGSGGCAAQRLSIGSSGSRSRTISPGRVNDDRFVTNSSPRVQAGIRIVRREAFEANSPGVVMKVRAVRAAVAVVGLLSLVGHGCGRRVEEDRSPAIDTIPGPAGALHIEDGGSGGVPVVFVHASAGDTEQWSAQLAHVRSQRRALGLDLRGHGRSDPPTTDAWTVGDFAADIDAVVDGLDLERVVLVGHSLGAAAALEYARREPEKVAGLVLVGAPGKVPPERAQQIMVSIEADYDSVMQGYWNKLLTNARPEVRDQVERGIGTLSRPASLAIIRGLFDHDPLPALQSYTGPKLAVVPAAEDNDPQALHKLAPDLPHKVITGTSHWVQMDKPGEFNQILDEFLGQSS